MGHDQRDAVGGAPRNGHIPHAECASLFRPETDDELLKTCRGMRDQKGPIAGRQELCLQVDWFDDREHLVCEVANERESSRRQLGVTRDLQSLD